MDTSKFAAELERDGYREIETKTLEPRPANGDHGHHFSVRGLVLDGEFIVTMDGVPRSYGPGEVFEVAEDTLHNEAIGPQGARILTGRKY
jgi:quercetin dioxygenase-like cupin family protein